MVQGNHRQIPTSKEVKMDDVDEKPHLPVHLILGVSDYAKIKTESKPKIGKPREPVAELTKVRLDNLVARERNGPVKHAVDTNRRSRL